MNRRDGQNRALPKFFGPCVKLCIKSSRGRFIILHLQSLWDCKFGDLPKLRDSTCQGRRSGGKLDTARLNLDALSCSGYRPPEAIKFTNPTAKALKTIGIFRVR